MRSFYNYRTILGVVGIFVVALFGFMAGRHTAIGTQRIAGTIADAEAYSGKQIHFVQRLGPYDIFRCTGGDFDYYMVAHITAAGVWAQLPVHVEPGNHFVIGIGQYYTYMWNGARGNTYAAARKPTSDPELRDLGEHLQDWDGDGVFEYFHDQTGTSWKRTGPRATDWERSRK